MKKNLRLIIGGLAFILVLAVSVFLSLNHFMDGQTEKDVRQIAKVYLLGMAEEENNRYETVKAIRFSQIAAMKESILSTSGSGSAKAVEKEISRLADFQDLSTCALLSEEGNVVNIYGNPIQRFGDFTFLLESMQEGREIITGGWDEEKQLIIYASPIEVPMTNGEKSIGILWSRPMETFENIMNLNAEDSLVYFHIIRHDASYVILNEDAVGDTYYQKVLEHAQPLNMTAEEAAEGLRQAIADNEVFFMDTTYTDEAAGIHERRSIYAQAMTDSNWYMVSIIPYGVLDQTIIEMGNARTQGMFLSVAVVAMGIVVVMLLYVQMTQRQMRELELARNQAEDAMVEAEAASEDAIRAKHDADVARDEAEAASRAKSEFLSNMSHDIRTPLNAVIGMTAIAQEHISDSARVEDCLKKISLSGKHLLGLINDVLDMSKIESGKMTLNPEAVSLRETMETMCDIIRGQLKGKAQNFDIFISNIIAEDVWCDSVRLNQVLLNFLGNAMKFTPEGGSISVSLWQEESPKGADYARTHMAVKDNGIGMTPEFQKKIFNAFEREDNLRVHQIQGSGLGMAITKYIVDAMGGTIEVESELGKGSTFHVTVDLEIVKEQKKEMKLPGLRVLMVDDNEELCRSAALSMEELGVEPVWCLGGEAAVKLVQDSLQGQEKFSVILIDYKMHGMSGIETARRIRELVPDIPISLISAYDWSDIEEEAGEVGVTGFIAKPLFKSTLYYGLKKYVAGDEAKEELEAGRAEKEISLKGMRILLAEDNFINAEIASTILEEKGVIVDVAENGKEAYDKFEASEEGYYHVILMDLRMPIMNGFEATLAIRAMKRADAADIPIIAMSADAFAEDVQKCLEAGMNGHLSKPIDVAALTKALGRYNGLFH